VLCQVRLAFGLDLGGWRAEVDGFPSLLLDGASGVRLSSSVLSPSELKDLVLDTAALDELGLPVRVLAGAIRRLELTVPWSALASVSVKVEIDGVHLVVAPLEVGGVSSSSNGAATEAAASEAAAAAARTARQRGSTAASAAASDAAAHAATTRRAAADEYALKAKRRALAKLEEALERELAAELGGHGKGGGGRGGSDDGGGGDGKKEKEKGFVALLVARIVDNLDVTVRNVHARYEVRTRDDVSRNDRAP